MDETLFLKKQKHNHTVSIIDVVVSYKIKQQTSKILSKKNASKVKTKNKSKNQTGTSYF